MSRKKVLLCYRAQAFTNEIKKEIVKYSKKNYEITLVVDRYLKNVKFFLKLDTDIDLDDINIYTVTELIDGALDNMKRKFDYIVGNPPYQKSDAKSDANNLYIDILQRLLPLLSKEGTMSMITPATVAQAKKTGFSLRNLKGLKYIDYTTNKSFNEGIKIISWQLVNGYDGTVKIINNDGSIDERLNLELMVSKEEKLGFELFEKIKCNKDKLFVGDQTTNGKRQKEQSCEYKYKIHVNIKKDKIEYSKVKPKLYNRKKAVVHMGAAYNSKNFIISLEDFGQYQNCIDITYYNNDEIENLKSFLFNEITILICRKYRLIYGTGMNNILYSFPKIDVTKKYYDNDVISVFNLTEEEVNWLKN